MKQRADCNRAFEPRQPYHQYCQALLAEPNAYARRQGWQTRPRRPDWARGIPWHPSWDLWVSGDWLLWVLFIAAPAMVIYAIGHLLGFW